MVCANLFADVPEDLPEELFQDLVHSPNMKIERIISRGHSSPEGHWYDQEHNEWVVVLKGKAALVMEGKDALVVLGPGDWVNIPSHCKHRVEWTDSQVETIWLAVHY